MKSSREKMLSFTNLQFGFKSWYFQNQYHYIICKKMFSTNKSLHKVLLFRMFAKEKFQVTKLNSTKKWASGVEWLDLPIFILHRTRLVVVD